MALNGSGAWFTTDARIALMMQWVDGDVLPQGISPHLIRGPIKDGIELRDASKRIKLL